VKNTRLRQACVLIDQAIDARDRQIVAMHEQGMTLREIADASGGHLSHGGVAGIIKRKTSQGPRTAPQKRLHRTEGVQP